MQYLNQLASTRRPWLLLAFTAFCLEITALYFQHVMKLEPCVMCIYERIAMMGIIATGLVGAIKPEFFATRWLGFCLWAISAFWGLQLALEHVDWLALYETLELVLEHQGDESIRAELVDRLKLETGDNAVLIKQGLQRLAA